MAWFLLLAAGVLETIWPVAAKYSDGMHRPVPTIIAVAAMVANVFLLGAAMRSLPVATVYGVLIGFGAVGTSLASIFLFREHLSTVQIVSLLFVILGIVGLKAGAPVH